MEPLVVFAHGKESGPWGSKIQHMAKIAEMLGCKTFSPDYSDLMDPELRVKRLVGLPLVPHTKLIMVGSSMGAYVSTLASSELKPDGLFLLAPAFYMPGYDSADLQPHAKRTSVVAGWNDEVIPVENMIRFAQTYQTELHVLNAGHRLMDVLDEVGELFEQFLKRVLSTTEVNLP